MQHEEPDGDHFLTQPPLALVGSVRTTALDLHESFGGHLYCFHCVNNIEAQVLSIAKHHELTYLLVVELVWGGKVVFLGVLVNVLCRKDVWCGGTGLRRCCGVEGERVVF